MKDRPTTGSASAIELSVQYAERLSRPLSLVKWLIIIPHFLALIVVTPVLLLAGLLTALAVWASGTYPNALLFKAMVASHRWWSNFFVYLSLLTDEYPPLNFAYEAYRPVRFDVPYPASLSQGLGFARVILIPLYVLAVLLLFPFLASIYLAPMVAGILGIWFTGRYPVRAFRLVVTSLAWNAQVHAFLHCLTDEYNPTKANASVDSSPGGRGATPAPSGSPMYPAQDTSVPFVVIPPEKLPTFDMVGGLEQLKMEIRNTLGLLLAFSHEADNYRVTWGGVLLYGPPGCGKTFISKAIAGELGLNYMAVGSAELIGSYRGQSARLIAKAFEVARQNRPCLLFFDEFDSVALSRSETPDPEIRNTVNQLLRSVEEHRPMRDLVVMAATNDIDRLDDAVKRPGRFDRHIRVDLPDQKTREAILIAQLSGRPRSDAIDFSAVASRCEGMSAAALAELAERCALDALREGVAEYGRPLPITTERLLMALDARAGQDRPSLAKWRWEDLALPEATKRELRELQEFVENPRLADEFGVDPPSGVLLHGPPGTGKTTIAKVLAAQARASFYAVSCSDILSKWVGETEKNISKLFQRARENKPSIIFFDEIDALFPKRGDSVVGGYSDKIVNQLLQEIDGIKGQRGVFVVGATNRPDILDPALLRGGRLSRHIEIPLPAPAERKSLLRSLLARMPVDTIDLDKLTEETEGFSGASLKSLTQEAALRAAARTARNHGNRTITHQDFDEALDDLKAQRMRSGR